MKFGLQMFPWMNIIIIITSNFQNMRSVPDAHTIISKLFCFRVYKTLISGRSQISKINFTNAIIRMIILILCFHILWSYFSLVHGAWGRFSTINWCLKQTQNVLLTTIWTHDSIFHILVKRSRRNNLECLLESWRQLCLIDLFLFLLILMHF